MINVGLEEFNWGQEFQMFRCPGFGKKSAQLTAKKKPLQVQGEENIIVLFQAVHEYSELS
jgi:hypothetical protein